MKDKNKFLNLFSIKFKGFTFVELIVVIMILAILSTIAVISFQGYRSLARDAKTKNNLTLINKMLSYEFSINGKLPFPDDKIKITASGELLGYQGIVGENILNKLGVDGFSDDILEKKYFTYTTNYNLSKHQLLGFLEGELNYNEIIKNTYVDYYDDNSIMSVGLEIGTILGGTGDSLNIPINEIESYLISGKIDLINYSGEELKLVLLNKKIIEGTGSLILSNIISRDKKLLDNKSLLKYDSSLVGYWDMESLSGSSLKDFSKYGNHSVSLDFPVGGYSGKKGEATFFDGINDYVEIMSSDSLNPKNITISTIIKFYGNGVKSSYYPRIISKGGTIAPELYSIWYNYYPPDPFFSHFHTRFDSFIRTVGYTNSRDTYYPINNKWINLDLVYDGESLKIYINGELFDYKVGPYEGDLYPSVKHLIIGNTGKIPSSLNFFYGLIDEVRIYNRALTQAEISTLYESSNN